MTKWLKILGFFFVGLIVLVVLATVAIKVFLPPEKVRSIIEKEVSAKLHRQMSLGVLSIDLIQGLQISDFKLSESPDFSKGIFISSEKFVVHPRLLPLLFKKVIIHKIELIKPQVS